jgi:hypothetical protein
MVGGEMVGGEMDDGNKVSSSRRRRCWRVDDIGKK